MYEDGTIKELSHEVDIQPLRVIQGSDIRGLVILVKTYIFANYNSSDQ